MRKFLSLLIVASFFALSAPAEELVQTPDVLSNETYTIGTEEFTAPTLDESMEEDLLSSEIGDTLRHREDEEWGGGPGRYRCHRGYRRVPAYRWDRRRHRWVFDGYTCRRIRHPDDGRPGTREPRP